MSGMRKITAVLLVLAVFLLPAYPAAAREVDILSGDPVPASGRKAGSQITAVPEIKAGPEITAVPAEESQDRLPDRTVEIPAGNGAGALTDYKAPASVTEGVSVTDPAAWRGKTVGDLSTDANIRSDASLEAPVAGYLLPGGIVSVRDRKDGWAYITSGNVSGYILEDLLLPEEEARERFLREPLAVAEVTAWRGTAGSADAEALLYEETSGSEAPAFGTPVFTGPSEDSGILGSYPSGARITVFTFEDGWYRILYHGQDGYVPAEALVFGDDTQTALTPQEFQAYLDKGRWFDTDDEYVGEEELRYLATIIYCEAGGESMDGKTAVASVVLNRVKSSIYPDSICEVIRDKGQFEPVTLGWFDRALTEEVPENCYDAARCALLGRKPVGCCLYFHAGKGTGIVIGNQTFSTDPASVVSG